MSPLRRLPVVLLGLLACPLGGVQAAEVDRASRSDVRDARLTVWNTAISPHDVPGFAGIRNTSSAKIFGPQSHAGGPIVDFTPSVAGAFATNAGQTRADPIAAGYITPGAALDLAQGLGAWALQATFTADADYYSESPADLNEGRLDADIVVGRPTVLGTAFFEYQARGSFSGDYDTHYYTQMRYKLGLEPEFGAALGLRVVAEYRASDTANQRRSIARATVSRSWPAKGNMPKGKISQELQLSDFRAGDNRNRTDVLSTTKLKAVWPLPQGLELEVGLSAFKNFSNRRDKRWLDIEFGPTLSRAF
jgi:hypothetical protein